MIFFALRLKYDYLLIINKTILMSRIILRRSSPETNKEIFFEYSFKLDDNIQNKIL